MRVTETAHWLEWQDWADPILAEPFERRERPPDRAQPARHGIAWNEDAVKRYRYDV